MAEEMSYVGEDTGEPKVSGQVRTNASGEEESEVDGQGKPETSGKMKPETSGTMEQADRGHKEQEIMELAMEAGHILLQNGAEIYRVEETIRRICVAYGVTAENAFVLSNGIFMTGESTDQRYFARVQYIPVSGTHLNKIAAINELSRQIELGHISPEQAKSELSRIREMQGHKVRTQLLAAGVGSGAFSCLFGGNLPDCAAAAVAGFCVYSFFVFIGVPHMSKIIRNIAGGFLSTAVCALFFLAGIGNHMDHMVIGSVMPLIPGVAFTNAIREIANEDYISGAVRLLDAMLIFLCIALGVGLSLTCFGKLFGGVGI